MPSHFSNGQNGKDRLYIPPVRSRISKQANPSQKLNAAAESLHEPPLNATGCARATPILSQIFGDEFNRKFIQPTGARYPMRGYGDPWGVYRHSYTSVYQPRRTKHKYPAPPRQTHTLPHFRQSSDYLEQPAPKEGWKVIHDRREEKISNQMAAKTVELAEFQKNFCDETTVRDVLTSGWYRQHLTEQVQSGPSDAAEQTNTSSGETSAKTAAQTEIDRNRAKQLVNCEHYWKTNKPRQPSKNKNKSKHLPSTPYVPPPCMRTGQPGTPSKNNQQLLPVKIQQHLPQSFVMRNVEHPSQRPEQQVDPRTLMPQQQDLPKKVDVDSTPRINLIEYTKARMTPNGTRSSTPNILRKNRSTEGRSSPMPNVDHALFGSIIAPTAPLALPPVAPKPAPMTDPTTQELASIPPTDSAKEAKPAEELKVKQVLDIPKKRERKQVLVSDNHYSSSTLYSLLQDDAPDEEQEVVAAMVALKVGAVKKEGNVKPAQNVPVHVPAASSELPPKKPRGRPRKDRSLTPYSAALQAPSKPPKDPFKSRAPRGSYKKKKLLTLTTEERNREDLILSTLPPHLQEAIQLQKVMDEEQKLNPAKLEIKKPRISKKQSSEEVESPSISLTESLQFLQSIAQMDASVLFSGLSPNILSQAQKPPPSPPPEPRATATVVATSGTPLTLNYDAKNPQIVEALIWTDDTGPLVPIAMYQKDKKIEKKPMLKQSRIEEIQEEIRMKSMKIEDSSAPSSSKKPGIVTKAALKLMPEHLQPPVIIIADSVPDIGSEVVVCENSEEAVSLWEASMQESQLIPLPSWQPPKNSVAREVPPAFRQLSETPCPEPPVQKVSEKPLKRIVKKKKKKKDRILSIQVLRIVKKYKRSLKKFNAGLFKTLIMNEVPEYVEVIFGNKKHPTKQPEEVYIAKAINSNLDKVIRNCATSKFEDHQTYIVSTLLDGTSTRFDFDWSSADVTSRWLPWNEQLVQSSFQTARRKMTSETMQDIRKLSGLYHRLVQNPECKDRTMALAGKIREIYLSLQWTLDTDITGPIGLALSFELKAKAAELRIRAARRKHEKLNEQLQNTIFEWKEATTNYVRAENQEIKDAVKPLMNSSLEKLNLALDLHSGLLDVIMFAARLQVLYQHAQSVYCGVYDAIEFKDIIRSVEDTEHLLLLSETKIFILENFNNNEIAENRSKIMHINAYMAADALNVKRGELRRLLKTPMMQGEINAMKRSLNLKVEKLAELCNNLDVTGILEQFQPANWDLPLESCNSLTGKTNILEATQGSDYSYSFEIPPRFLSSTVFKRTFWEMMIKSPQMTSIVDEKLLKMAESEKDKPKGFLRMFLRMFEEENQEHHRRIQELKKVSNKDGLPTMDEQRKHFDELLEKIKHDVTSLGSVVNDTEVVAFNPVRDVEMKLEESIQMKMCEFRSQKTDQANRRREMASKLAEKQRGQGSSKSLTSAENAQETIKHLIESIRFLNKEMRQSTDEKTREDARKLLEVEKMHYMEIQEKQRMIRAEKAYAQSDHQLSKTQFDEEYMEMMKHLEQRSC